MQRGHYGASEFSGDKKEKGGAQVSPFKRKPGRPKGSTKKKKDHQGEENRAPGGDIVIGNSRDVGMIEKEKSSEATGFNGEGNENNPVEAKHILGAGQRFEGSVGN